VHKADPSHPTREKILDTAQNLFLSQGYGAAGINALCLKAGVVKGSFYHFFASKQALLSAVIERNRTELMNDLNAASQGEADGRKRILAQLSTVLSTAEAHKNASGSVLGCSVGSLASEMAVGDEIAGKASANTFIEWQALLEGHIQAGIADGSIVPTVNPKTTAWCVLAVIQGMSTLGRSFNDPNMLAEIAQLAVKRLLPVPAQ